MKGQLLQITCLFLLQIVKISVADPVGACPNSDGILATYLTDSKSCSIFYICDSGVPHKYDCPAGLHFSATINVCVYPQAANCEGLSQNNDEDSEETIDVSAEVPEQPETPGNSNENTNEEENQPVGECPKVDGEHVTLLPHEVDCTKFYICNQGTPVVKECQSGLLFNPILLVCDYAELAGCEGASSGNGNSSDNTSDEKTQDGSAEEEETPNNGGESQAIGECPEVDGEDVTLLPHKSNCTKFYICDRGTPVVAECPSGLLFNPTLLVCDYPELAGCESASSGNGNNSDSGSEGDIPDGSEDDEETGSDGGAGQVVGECPEVDGDGVTLLPHESNCSKFYICNEGTPVVTECPSGLLFNPTLLVCDYPELAGCEGESSGNGDNSDSGSEGEIPEGNEEDDETESNGEAGQVVGECPEVDGNDVTLLPHKTNCTKFYICDRGTPVVAECPSGLLFNPTLLVCDYPELAGCQAVSSGNGDNSDSGSEGEIPEGNEEDDETESNGEASQIVGECPEVDGNDVTLLPHKTNCTKFYICDRGTPVVAECPSGLLFNPTFLVCDYPELAGCEAVSSGNGDNSNSGSEGKIPDGSEEDEETESNSEESQSIGECPEVDGDNVALLPHKTNCTKFYICNEGNPVLAECPGGLQFNPNLSVCDYPELAGCGAVSSGNEGNGGNDGEETPVESEEEETPGNSGGNQAIGECPEIDGELVTLLPHGADCTKFYICYQGTPVITACQPGLLFNPTLLVCDYPESAGCKGASSGNGNNSENSSEEETIEESAEDEETSSNDGGSQAIGQCPEVDGELVQLLPHASDCTKFYICSEGEPVVQNCPANLLFNHQLLVCDWPENAGCV